MQRRLSVDPFGCVNSPSTPVSSTTTCVMGTTFDLKAGQRREPALVLPIQPEPREDPVRSLPHTKTPQAQLEHGSFPFDAAARCLRSYVVGGVVWPVLFFVLCCS